MYLLTDLWIWLDAKTSKILFAEGSFPRLDDFENAN